MAFIEIWIGYTFFGVSALSAMFIWAVRKKQFSNLGRGGSIPLDADTMPGDTDQMEHTPKWADRYTPVILASLVCISLILALWLGMRHT